MIVAAVVPIASWAKTPGQARPAEGASEVEAPGVDVPVQLARPDRPGSIPAVARVLTRQLLEFRCTRIALLALQPSVRFFTPDSLPLVHARLYLPHRRSDDPVTLTCELTEVAVSDSDEFVLRVRTADLSREDEQALARLCRR